MQEAAMPSEGWVRISVVQESASTVASIRALSDNYRCLALRDPQRNFELSERARLLDNIAMRVEQDNAKMSALLGSVGGHL